MAIERLVFVFEKRFPNYNKNKMADNEYKSDSRQGAGNRFCIHCLPFCGVGPKLVCVFANVVEKLCRSVRRMFDCYETLQNVFTIERTADQTVYIGASDMGSKVFAKNVNMRIYEAKS